MYAIKMEADKSLVTTIHATIYQNDKNADTLVFLVPQKYEKENLADCTTILRYILPDGTAKSEELEMRAEPYNEDYYQYHLKVNTKFTEKAGEITLWLSVINPYDDLIFRTGTAEVFITAVTESPTVLPENALEQITVLNDRVTDLEKEKADNLIVSEDEQYIQLTSDGTPIGRKITVDLSPDDASEGEAADAATDEEVEEMLNEIFG